MFNSEVDIQTQSTDQNKHSDNQDIDYSTTSSSSSSQSSQSSFNSSNSSLYFRDKSLNKSNSKRSKKDKIQSQKKVKSQKNVKLSLMKVISNQNTQKEESNKNLNSIKEFENLESLVTNEKINLTLQKKSLSKKCSVEDTYQTNKSNSFFEKESDQSKQEIIPKSEEDNDLQQPSIIEKLASITDKQLSNNKLTQIKQHSSLLSETSDIDISCKSPRDNQEENHKRINKNRDSNSRKYTLQVNKDLQEIPENDQFSSQLSEDNIKKNKIQSEKKLKSHKKKAKHSKLQHCSLKDMNDDKYSSENQIEKTYQALVLALSQGQRNSQFEANNFLPPNRNLEDHLTGLSQKRSKSIKCITDSHQNTQNPIKRNTQLGQSSIFKKLSIAQDSKNFQLPYSNQYTNSNSIVLEQRKSQINNRTSHVIGLPSSNNLANNLTNSQLIAEKIQKLFGTTYLNAMNQQQGNLTQNDNPNSMYKIEIDKMKSYKKFYPQNNIENILNQLMSKQNISKKQKKTKQQPIVKNRRQNIYLQQNTGRKSMFSNIINNKSAPSIIHQDLFKPTYLQYGTCLKNDSMFPKNALKKEFITSKQND